MQPMSIMDNATDKVLWFTYVQMIQIMYIEMKHNVSYVICGNYLSNCTFLLYLRTILEYT